MSIREGPIASDQLTTLLEMTERPTLHATRPHRGGMLLRLDEPSPDFYRFLVRSIDGDAAGALELGDDNLFEYLQDPLIDVFVLFIGGAPAGLFELDRRAAGEVELVRVGLLSVFRGRGLAKYLLGAAVEAAWDDEPDRVWVAAATAENPRSLLLYQWAGFVPFVEEADG